MLMANASIYLTFLLLICLLKSGQSAPKVSNNYVQDACSVTRYRALCVNSLASFSSTAKKSPGKWARAGVSVTIGETKNVAQYLMKVKNYREMRGRYKIPLSDCIECFQNAIDQLHESLGILRKLSARNFYAQMGDVTTWLSAALTDQDTCLDGFENPMGKQAKMLRNRVLRSSYFTSNALALVNKLATSGLKCLNDP
ncbi:pectinesterase inhibitor 6-like [Durio zibethinus]|uniref:Pectinesterase inhibitor 6-like n=1 Tax=Durio zibethinus TaxID=66656 RepID=A0A6P5XJK0_DURZI|nr:pectinesterase inhibitor 6-like [Durio zibethinus]